MDQESVDEAGALFLPRRTSRTTWCGLLLSSLLGAAVTSGQAAPAGSPTTPPAVSRIEGTDEGSGIRYVRLTISGAPPGQDSGAEPHFTVECTEANTKRALSFYLSPAGITVPGFTPPFRPTPEHMNPPVNASDKLTMTFEGYQKWKPLTRVWELLPSGELRYRNPGMHSPNMEEARSYLAYLSSLPTLRIWYANRQPADALLFQTRPLLDEVARTPLCEK